MLRAAALFLLAVVVSTVFACGKKGPPTLDDYRSNAGSRAEAAGTLQAGLSFPGDGPALTRTETQGV